MKKIPESVELDEADIKEAIEYWLENKKSVYGPVEVFFDMKKKTIYHGGPGVSAGMSGYSEVLVLSAKATKKVP